MSSITDRHLYVASTLQPENPKSQTQTGSALLSQISSNNFGEFPLSVVEGSMTLCSTQSSQMTPRNTEALTRSHNAPLVLSSSLDFAPAHYFKSSSKRSVLNVQNSTVWGMLSKTLFYSLQHRFSNFSQCTTLRKYLAFQVPPLKCSYAGRCYSATDSSHSRQVYS